MSSINDASFRDPAGFIFESNGILYRQINARYQAHYTKLIDSGLYKRLVETGLLIPHKEVALDKAIASGAVVVIQPEHIARISYPYEWSFGQLKDAALATIEIQKIALEFGMTLKDASAYNMQFLRGKPVLIDTLSFEIYEPGQPWIAYRQFCQHFLAPLALQSYVDVRLSSLSRNYIDGLPLDLAARLLPAKARLNLGLLTHLHLHAQAQGRYAHAATLETKQRVSEAAQLGILAHLQSTIEKLTLAATPTEWGDYYNDTNYSKTAFQSKLQIVADLVESIHPTTVCDIGANNSLYSQIAETQGIQSIAVDIDPIAVELAYQSVKNQQLTNMLPLIIDITNPSPNLGWRNKERTSFTDRFKTDAVIALAIIHHLAISHNLPIEQIAEYFAELAPDLIIEFVPKHDSQVQRLLANREDIFSHYTQQGFESAFEKHYRTVKRLSVKDSQRTIYHMKRK